MKTKEAIEFLEGQKQKLDDPVEPNRLGIDLVINDIIELLQRGEKFEQMWEEIKKDSYGCEAWWSKCGLMRYEQKYFPKAVKKTIRIEIEGGDNIDLGLAKIIMKKALTDWNFKKNIKFEEVD